MVRLLREVDLLASEEVGLHGVTSQKTAFVIVPAVKIYISVHTLRSLYREIHEEGLSTM
jgi:hypothetical protein